LPCFGHADFRRTIKVFDTTTRRVLHTLEGHFSDDGCSCFSPDGQLILGVDGQSLKLWNAKTGTLRHTLYGHSDDVSCCSFSPDGKTILSGSLDWDLILWDTLGCRLLHFQGHSSCVTSCAFSPDGKTIVSGSLDCTIVFWDASTSNPVGTIEGHSSRVHFTRQAWSPDGKTMLSSSGNTTKLWDVRTMKCLQILHAGDDITSCCFSPDGAKIACASGFVNLWD